MLQYHVAIWQNTVAPDDPGGTAQAIEDWLNELAAEHWNIIQVDTHAMVNNIFRAIAFCSKSGAAVKSEAPAAEKEPEPEPEDDAPKGKRHR